MDLDDPVVKPKSKGKTNDDNKNKKGKGVSVTAPPSKGKPGHHSGKGKAPIPLPTTTATVQKSGFQDQPSMYNLSSWTGKTPVVLLHEISQKKKWSRDQTKEGYVVRCVIGKADRGGSTTTITYKAPEPCKYAMDAKFRTAVFALHAINSHLSMSMNLPPGLRDYWVELNETHKLLHRLPVPGEPFETKAPKTAEFQKKMENISLPPSPMTTIPTPEPPKKKDVVAKKYVKVNMSTEIRAYVEEVINSVPYEPTRSEVGDGISSLFVTASEKESEHAKKTRSQANRRLVDSLSHMGFRRAHVEEATLYARDRQGILDWLCMNVPEDDLPEKWRPLLRDVISNSTNDRDSLKIKWAIDRLHSVGFDQETCREALELYGYNDQAALAHMVRSLVYGSGNEYVEAGIVEDFTDDELIEMKENELEGLKSMYEDSMECVSDSLVTFVFNRAVDKDLEPSHVSGPGKGKGCIRGRGGSKAHNQGAKLPDVEGETILEIHFAPGSRYPADSPVVVVRNRSLPAYIRLSIIQAIGQELAELQGHPVIYNAVTWLETSMADLIANPPPLSKTHLVGKRVVKGHESDSSMDDPINKSTNKGERRGRGHNKPRNTPTKPIVNKASAAMLDKRSQLPAHAYREIIAEMITKHQVVVVGGETGCGKTTQVPQFILDLIGDQNGTPCNVICTQPRRLAATAVAERVADERGESIGQTVGYSIRLEARQGPETRLLFCTTGILLRRLQSDPDLEGVTHVLVDEVHERSLDSDILLVILRELLKRKPCLHLVLMSATLDANLFSKYFNGAPTVSIPGRTKPVTNHFLEDILTMLPSIPSSLTQPRGRRGKDDDDWESAAAQYLKGGVEESVVEAIKVFENARDLDYSLCTALTEHISNSLAPGAILIFLTGLAEIRQCCEALKSANTREKLLILPLHSSLTSDEQSRIFQPAPKGSRKVVVATNIAETSITVDDVVYVIDFCKVKETRYDAERSMSMLVECLTSKASTRQRMGRAGRVREGFCYKLLSKRKFDRLADQSLPEIMRTPLEQVCLFVKSMGIYDIASFLQQAPSPPETANIRAAINTLQDLGALDWDEELTALGKHMANLPVDVRIGKFILYGAIFRCVEPVLTMAACLSYRSPFVSPMDKREEAKAAMMTFAISKSDHLTCLKAYEGWRSAHKEGRGAEREYLEENFLSRQTLMQIHDLKKQYMDALVSIGFVDKTRVKASRTQTSITSDIQAHASSVRILKAVLCAGLYPNVIRVEHPKDTYQAVGSGNFLVDPNAKDIKMFDKNRERLFIHPASINFTTKRFEDGFLVYHSKVKTSKIFVRDTTMVGPYALLLFGGEVGVDHEHQKVTVDNWIRLDAAARIG
eukprot:Ihof_evm1s359 gene=Ihof_evmTU1s359